jgi:uroporphyrinogen-III decarboxylase
VLNGNPIANLVLHITQLHCPVNANTITERIGNISEVFATNLGHGITPDVDPENMAVLVEAVHNFRSNQ